MKAPPPFTDHFEHRPNYDYKNHFVAPKGWRLVNLGEKYQNGDFWLDYESWEPASDWMMGQDINICTVNPVIRPVLPELIPPTPNAKVVLEVVKRTTWAVKFKIASQSPDLPQDELLFTASNGIKIKSYSLPEVDLTRNWSLYIRGTNRDEDNTILSCTPNQFNKVVAAVNEFNGIAPKTEEPKAETPVSSEPPKYTGPRIELGDPLAVGIAKAGPAPAGWRYVGTDEKLKSGDFVLFKDGWVVSDAHHSPWIGFLLSSYFWPVIRRVKPCSPPVAPETTIADLNAKIRSLEAEVAALKGKIAGAKSALRD